MISQEALEIKAKNVTQALTESSNPVEVLKTVFNDIHVEAIEMVAQKFLEVSNKANSSGDINMANRYAGHAREIRALKSGAR